MISVNEALIYSSFRRMPESMSLKSLDPGMRRNDGKVINQRFPNEVIRAYFPGVPGAPA
jgi:hypothetical protein